MEIDLAIRAKPRGPLLTYNEWCAFIRQRPEFVRAAPVVGKNPFNGEPMTIYPRGDGATVVIGGRKVGTIGWSLLGEDEVIVSGEADDVLPFAQNLAGELGCKVEMLKE